MKHLLLIIILTLVLYSCTEEVTQSPTAVEYISDVWTGRVVTYGYIHSLSKALIVDKFNVSDSLFQDTNPDNTLFTGVFGILKIGKSKDSLSNGSRVYWTPQNGFIVFDLPKSFGGTVSNITTANLKIKLYKKSEYTNDLKFIVSVLDTTILTKTVKERIEIVQNSAGESAGYLEEITIDLKDRFSAGGRAVVGIRAENANQLFASVQTCKIEFAGDVRRAGDAQPAR